MLKYFSFYDLYKFVTSNPFKNITTFNISTDNNFKELFHLDRRDYYSRIMEIIYIINEKTIITSSLAENIRGYLEPDQDSESIHDEDAERIYISILGGHYKHPSIRMIHLDVRKLLRLMIEMKAIDKNIYYDEVVRFANKSIIPTF